MMKTPIKHVARGGKGSKFSDSGVRGILLLSAEFELSPGDAFAARSGINHERAANTFCDPDL
jgi:hypothetical protein